MFVCEKMVVHLSHDLLSRASMRVVNGRSTLTINTSSTRELWLEGLLRHEIGEVEAQQGALCVTSV